MAYFRVFLAFLSSRLALAELGSAAGLLEAVLLALDHASIARKETGLLEVSTVVASVQKSASDAQAQSAGLTGDAAAIAQSDNVELTGGVGHLEGSKGVLNELMTACLLYTSPSPRDRG